MKSDLEQETSAPAEAGAASPPPEAGFLSSLARTLIFDSLQYDDFRWIFLGSFASFMAMNMQMITRAWLVVCMMDDSPLALSLSYVASDRTLLDLVIMTFIPALFGYSYFALLPAWGREALDVQSDGLGVLMMLMGIGALAGTLVLASLGNFNRRGAVLLLFNLLWGASLAVFANTGTYAQAIPLLIIIGLVNSVYMSLNMTLVQTYAAAEMRGRVMSISMMSFGVMPLSSVPFGILAEFTDTAFALMLSEILLVAFTLKFAILYPGFRRVT